MIALRLWSFGLIALLSSSATWLCLPRTAFTSATTDIYGAAETGDFETVSQAIREGIDVNAVRREVNVLGEEKSETPLFLAAREGHAAIVELLLESGADPDVRCSEGGTALTIAAARDGREVILRMLLDSGADVLGPRPMKRTAFGWAAMNGDYGSFLVLLDASRAAGMQREEELRALKDLEHRNDDLRHLFTKVLRLGDGMSPLQRAARSGSLQELEAALKEAGSIRCDDDGWSPLHWAAGLDGTLEKTRFLIEAGADVNAKTKDGFTPLMAAIQTAGMDRVAAVVAAGARPNDVDVDSSSALHVAAWRCDEGIIQVLLDHGADVKLTNRWSQTALHVAEARKNNLGVDVTGVLKRAWDSAQSREKR